MKPFTHQRRVALAHFLGQRLFDRDRQLAFARFLGQRFFDDSCFEAAGALSYSTVFALVPLTATVLGILSAFPMFDEWTETLTAFVFQNFVPSSGIVLQGYLTDFAKKASSLTGAGIAALLITALMTMASIEHAYNRIWRVVTPRRRFARFVMYWTALTLGPLLVAAGLALSSYLFTLPLLGHTTGWELQAPVMSMLPFLVTLAGITLSYLVIPNRSVRFFHAFAGGVLATLLFELSKYAFVLYLSSAPSYEMVYGAISVVPILLIWIYVSWVVVLLGASFAASLSAFDYRPLAQRLPPGYEFLGLLGVLRQLSNAHQAGQTLTGAEMRVEASYLSDDLLQRYLADLQALAIVQRNERGGWILARDLYRVELSDLFEAGGYRLPLGSTFALPVEHPLATLAPKLIKGAAGLKAALNGSVGEIFRAVERSEDEEPIVAPLPHLD